MYKLIEHISNISSFAINDTGDVAITCKNEFSIIKKNNFTQVFVFQGPEFSVQFNKQFFLNCDWGVGCFLQNQKIIDINGCIEGFSSQNELIVRKFINEKGYFYSHNIDTQVEVSLKNPINTFSEFTKEAVYQRKFPSKTILEKVSLIDNQIVWQNNLKTLGKYFKKEYEIIRVIGVHNGELLVGCSNNVLLAINHETGEIIYQWQALEHTGDYRFPKSKIGSYHSALLLPSENKLVGGGNRSLWEIDLITRAIVVNDLAEEFTKNNINSLTGDKIHSANDTHLILTAYTNEDLDYFKAFLVIFALNKKTYKIDWIHNFGTAMTGTERKTEVAGNKLYQLDTDGNLFIFEKV